MDRMLEKMAKQLNAYDQSSLMSLWQRYADKVKEFEPTKEWEESALALCMIQAIHWKNQLFNYHLASVSQPGAYDAPPIFMPAPSQRGVSVTKEETPHHKATILAFPDKKKQHP